MNMIQPILCGGESIETDLSVFLNSDESTYDAYIGVALLERVNVDPEDLQHKMLVGRLWNAGAKLCDLNKAFGHDNRTIKKWGNALKSGDMDEMARAFTGRRILKKTTPELIRYIRQLYTSRDALGLGRAYRQEIILMIEDVFGVTISPSLASAIFQEVHKEKEEYGNGDLSSKEVISGQTASVSGSNELPTVQTSPIFPFLGGGLSGMLSAGVLIRHAGMVLFGLWLRLYDSLERQFICQVLQGAVNVEQSKSLCHDSLGYFTSDLVRTLRSQRWALEQRASLKNTLDLYKHNARLLPDGPGKGDLFYFDPHTKEYTGQLKILKGWCGRRHGIRKVVNLDCFHTRSGRPCFIQHYSPYYDMRERFFMSLELFDCLFDEDKRRGRTFVIDRAIYGLEALRRFEFDHVITWEKGFDGFGWDPEKESLTFTRFRPKNHSGDLNPYTFQCQEFPWKRDPRFRRILVKVGRGNGEELTVSIICSHPTMDIQDVVWAIFNRWIQENDFKYLDTHVGLNQLDSRAFTDFKEEAESHLDGPVDCPEYKERKSELRELENKLAKQLLKLRRAEKKLADQEKKKRLFMAKAKIRLKKIEIAIAILKDENDCYSKWPKIDDGRELLKSIREVQRKLKKAREDVEKLKTAVSPLENKVEALAERLATAVRKQSRIQLLIDGNYKLLVLRRKNYMDALRVNAINMFRNLHERFRSIRNNYRDDHERLRILTRCDGFLSCTNGIFRVRLWLPGSIQTHDIDAMETFVSIVAGEINDISEHRNLKIEITTGPVKTSEKVKTG